MLLPYGLGNCRRKPPPPPHPHPPMGRGPPTPHHMWVHVYTHPHTHTHTTYPPLNRTCRCKMKWDEEDQRCRLICHGERFAGRIGIGPSVYVGSLNPDSSVYIVIPPPTAAHLAKAGVGNAPMWGERNADFRTLVKMVGAGSGLGYPNPHPHPSPSPSPYVGAVSRVFWHTGLKTTRV
jgi:hypothetical protein